MNRRLLVLGLALATTAMPMAATAHHFSAGYEDAVGLEPSEDDEKSVSDAEHAVGVSSDCHEPSDEVSAEEARRSATEDAFCGELRYAEDTPFTQTSGEDQDLRAPIGTFDVMPASSVPAGFGTCIPICPGDVLPGGDVAWDVVHTAGRAGPLDLTDEPDRAREEASTRRFQSFGAVGNGPWASSLAQETTGAWEMNGWWLPGGDRDFVAFLENEDGESLGPDELDNIVDNQGADLPGDASATVCGMSPDVDPIDFADTFIGLGDTGSACELTFEYVEPGDGEPNFRNGYQDRCNSPTYVCGAVGGAYWQSDGYLSTVDTASFANGDLQGAGLSSQDDYVVWHWVVGHSQAPCQGQIEPGIDFAPGTTKPYLAHDLDVYVPVTAADVAKPVSQVGLQEYGAAIADNATGQALDAGDQANEAASGALPSSTPGPVNDAVNTTTDAAFLALKNHRVEPNNAEAVEGLDDTSQEQIVVPRSFEDPCTRLSNPEQFDDPETARDESTIDPWVNILDSEMLKYVGTGGTNPVTFYGNADQNQDKRNAPGPSFYISSGKTGIFTDKDAEDGIENDDGFYDQIGDESKYDAGQVSRQGAYPMLWDMWADDSEAPENPQIDETGGCERVDERPFSTVMEDAGYGVNTGLVQAVYLREPTVWTDVFNGEAAVFDGGNNIYLQMSEGARDLWDEDPSQTSNPLDAEVDDLVRNLKAYAADQGPGSENDIGVIQPGQIFGLRHDWGAGQCTSFTGGWFASMAFLHDCTLDCAGDTVVTMYTFEVTGVNNGKLGDGGVIPIFAPNNQDFNFGANTQHTWYDVDPFDGDPDRNDDECSKPPNLGYSVTSPSADPDARDPEPFTNCNDISQ